MRKIILIFVTAAIFYSCSKKSEQENNVLGTWSLIETLNDPGDGSAQFAPVESDKTIQFDIDGNRVISNESFCSFNPNVDGTTGTFNEATGTILPDNCFDEERAIHYTIQGQNLILEYPCIERCSEKYIQSI